MEEDEDATLLDPRLEDGFEDVAGDVGALWSGVRGSASSFCTAGEGMLVVRLVSCLRSYLLLYSMSSVLLQMSRILCCKPFWDGSVTRVRQMTAASKVEACTLTIGRLEQLFSGRAGD